MLAGMDGHSDHSTILLSQASTAIEHPHLFPRCQGQVISLMKHSARTLPVCVADC